MTTDNKDNIGPVNNIKKYKNALSEKYNNFRSFFKKAYNRNIITMYIIDALLVTFIIEILARHSLIKGVYYFIASPYVIICNAMIVLMTLSVSLLMRKRIFGMTVISSIWLICGIINSVLLTCRVTPFTVSDIFLIDSAFKIINKYFSPVRIVLTAVAVIVFFILLIVVWKIAPKVDHKINIVRNLVGIVVICVMCTISINLGIGSELLSVKFGNLSEAYKEYGFIYCFANGILNTGVSKPSDYSDEKINSLKEQALAEKKKKIKNNPNIIFLQLESFFDVNHMKNIEFSSNPLPFFTELKEKYPHGYFNVPVVGAGTVNTEFEVMTGMNLDDFGPGEYPYKTVVNDETCESICYNLAEYDYTCHAIHNNTGTFYGRNLVFANLGYNTFTSIENMNIASFTPVGWAKDRYLTYYIKKALESTSGKDFIYAISVQGHGSYPDQEVDYPIKANGFDDEDRKYSFEYYVQQINEMDDFIKDLTASLSNYDEKIILVLYGDHLPSLGITEEELDNEDVYKTEYVIWSNYDIEYENEDIEAYELEPKILEKLKISEGYINAYSQKHRNDADNEEFLSGLKNLEYDMLYGSKMLYDGENPYTPTELKFGIREVKLNSISPLHDNSGNVFLYGRSFTNSSKVYLNGEFIETGYVDASTLKITYPELKDGDVFKVVQETEEGEQLNCTGELVYQNEDIIIEEKSTAENKDKKNKKNKKKKENNDIIEDTTEYETFSENYTKPEYE